MPSDKPTQEYIRERVSGFTLVETLVVLGLMALIIQLSLTEGIDSYDRENAHSDRTLLLGALREARAESMNDVCLDSSDACTSGATEHGVFISDDSLTIFEGSSYANRYVPADQRYPFSAGTKRATSSSDEVTFLAGTGNTSSSTYGNSSISTISIIGPDTRTETIQINSQGEILSSTLSSNV